MKSKLALITILLAFAMNISAQDTKALEGRWDLVVSKDGKELPSWLEVKHSGHHTLIGRFVYAFGSARPISEVKFKDGKFNFSIPPQWEEGDRNMDFEGTVASDAIQGTMVYTDGKSYTFKGTKAPLLARDKAPAWDKSVTLFNGKDMKGWHTEGANQWVVESGVLKSPKSGSNLLSDGKYNDFKLHVEFRCPKGSNSGLYLRGRYEVQIMDSKGENPDDGLFAGIYGFLTPNEMAAKDATEWQTYDITLIGRTVTVVANGKSVITAQLIPGITGGAIDSKEGEAGPLMIQGDHGPIEFKNITITPAK
ncbi:MAG TPA: DUF1080 domain-containing protein [Cyclobacteriaceae bacterium]|nr:DUF1080 domain-containing protein [Cyclobacteriaceae bacterium]